MSKTALEEEYIERAMQHAELKELEDGSWVARIPQCVGVLAFGVSREASERELQSTLIDWLHFSIERGTPIPVLDGIDLNAPRERGSVTA